MFFWHTQYILPDDIRTYSIEKILLLPRSRLGHVEAKYGSYVIAEDVEEAKFLLKRRGLKEKITSDSCKVNQRRRIGSVAKAYKKRELSSCLHTLSFVGLQLINAKLIKPVYLLSDTGLIHEVVHEIAFADDFMFQFSKPIYQRMKDFDVLMCEIGY